jgi:predicted enzyme related to lactoylglutathione lyase
MTKDVAAAQKFYGELLGWETKKDGEGPYTLITLNGKNIGGILPFDKPPMPSHWIGYISTTNLDHTIEHITKNGGKILVGKSEIPKVGTFAVAQDPTGGVFAPFQDATNTGPVEIPEKPLVGTFSWNELLSSDPPAAEKFYHHVFSWTSTHMDMGKDAGQYTLFNHHHHKKNIAGMMKLPQGVPMTAWLHYVHVEDADAVYEKAKKMGAVTPMPIMSMPDVGRFAPMMDPQGAAFAIIGPNK